MPDLLLEIGVEELPARLCPVGMEQLASRGAALLAEARLGFAAARAMGTPRRLAWLVEALEAHQGDAQSSVRGPARAAAFAADGTPTPAAAGFARSQGIAPEALVVREVGGKAYVFAERTVPGRPAAEVLAELLPRLISALDFPRSMRWGSGDFRFPRPIRWLVALLGPEIIPFELAGLTAGRTTYGHRTLHPGPLTLGRPDEYVQALRDAAVMVDVGERRRAVWDGVRSAVQAIAGEPRPNAELLDEVTHINEWPTAFAGHFAPEALEVPEEVLVTVMRVHQRYFPVQDESGHLLPYFAGVRNGGTDNLQQVAAGNEKVLAARFADARFFYEEDRKAPLAERIGQLGSVAFAQGLGTLADKTARLMRLGAWLAPLCGADAVVVVRAAELCKADRLTHVVYELPELEGTMGAHYAAADGEPEAVVAAIAEHVLPRDAAGDLPATPAGRTLALADRLDTLAGQFMIGKQPTGGADPLGLRRAALAVIRILEDAQSALPLREAVAEAAAGYPAGTGDAGALPAFLVARLRGRLEEAGFRHDVVDAVLAAADDDVAGAFARCRVLAEAVGRPGWEDVVTAFKRAGNLARQGGATGDPDEALLPEPTATALLAALGGARQAAQQAMEQGDYASILATTASLRAPVDDFLTAVLVMDPDPAVRASRLALLSGVAAIPAAVADLGLLMGEQGPGRSG